MRSPHIDQIRRFNRTVAQTIGAMDERFLGLARPMGESRLLWEIGEEGAELRALRARLALDSGYLSRTLASLQKQGLLTVQAQSGDRRVRRAELTEAGLKERAELDRRSDTVAADMLAPLRERHRTALVAAMAEVERLLSASFVRFEITDPSSEEARWCFAQYFAELAERFETGFDPALSLSASTADLMAPRGVLIVARLRDRPVGCVALKLHGSEPAELKRMWISSEARGLGVGARLLAEAESHAQKSGVCVIRLETNRTLHEAIALYRRLGYREVPAFNSEPYAHHWFEKELLTEA